MKLEKIKKLQTYFPFDKLIEYSLEDLQDAYLMAKSMLFKKRIELLLNQLDQANDKKYCHHLYRELENLEEMLYLVEKKYSKTLKKEIKKEKSFKK